MQIYGINFFFSLEIKIAILVAVLHVCLFPLSICNIAIISIIYMQYYH